MNRLWLIPIAAAALTACAKHDLSANEVIAQQDQELRASIENDPKLSDQQKLARILALKLTDEGTRERQYTTEQSAKEEQALRDAACEKAPYSDACR